MQGHVIFPDPLRFHAINPGTLSISKAAFFRYSDVMSKTLLFLLGAFALATLPSGASLVTSEAENASPKAPEASAPAAKPPKGYQWHKTGDFRLAYPSHWTVNSGSFIAFMDSKQTLSEDFVFNVVVLSEAVPPSMSVRQYVDLSVGKLDELLTDYQLLDQKSAAAENSRGVLLTYTHRYANFDLWVYQYVTVHEGKGWVVTCTAPLGEQAKGMDIFKTAIASFQLQP